eukprot:4956647-Pleurochrysis_carterae.AAC.1
MEEVKAVPRLLEGNAKKVTVLSGFSARASPKFWLSRSVTCNRTRPEERPAHLGMGGTSVGRGGARRRTASVRSIVAERTRVGSITFLMRPMCISALSPSRLHVCPRP